MTLMNKNPDFYLTSTETSNVFDVRTCYTERRLKIKNRNEYLLARISPPIQQPNGDNIDKIVLTVRFAGNTLFPINEWPMNVYVCKVLNEETINTDAVSVDDLKIILWGSLFKSFDEAKYETEKYAKQLKDKR